MGKGEGFDAELDISVAAELGIEIESLEELGIAIEGTDGREAYFIHMGHIGAQTLNFDNIKKIDFISNDLLEGNVEIVADGKSLSLYPGESLVKINGIIANLEIKGGTAKCGRYLLLY